MSLEIGLGRAGRAEAGPVYVKPALGMAAKLPVQVPQAQQLWRNCVNLLLIQ